ncbi:MAG: hypothetical protein HOM14_00315 [Gammaproteobacteria bacterium]|jgi:uncharacterized membrane protein|nr:hypothetical protein [Gammaproteobacteria bacterium]MBT4195637.1 hypothetical protein [Gammaproteobacteria bacterium]MBT4860943.1 hypothetical protein [Gammaproteobacteria bacterium]MBT6454511.1 hypothetical protein [Gammaproteobacteria bacterium]MBT6549776.1 hypothetical protein [Gammaproteobacteria bacterium]
MNYQSVRKGVTKARFNEDNSGIIYSEIIFIAIGVGLVMKSWWWGGGLLFGLIFALAFRPLALLIVFLLSVGWGVIGGGIGYLFDSDGAMFVLGTIGFMTGLGAHLSALEWIEDIGTTRETDT